MQRKSADSQTRDAAFARCRARPVAMRGVTLLELMVTLVVAAILLAVAVPDFRRFMSKTNMTQTANSLVGDLQFARAQASVTGVPICVVPNGIAGLQGPNWAKGWSVMGYNATKGTCDVLPALRTHEALPSGATVTTDQAGIPKKLTQIIFAAAGNVQLTPAADTKFHLCKTAGNQAQRVLVLVIAAGTTSSYRDISANGSSCP